MHNVTTQQGRHRCGNLDRRQKGTSRTNIVQPIHSLVILHLSFIDAFAHCAASVNKEQSLENRGEQLLFERTIREPISIQTLPYGQGIKY